MTSVGSLSETRHTPRWVKMVAILALAAIGTVAIAYFVLSDSAEDRQDLDRALEHMATVVESALGHVPKEREQLAESFFRVYTQKHWRIHQIPNKNHPDIQFLTRLPEQVQDAPRVFLRNRRTKPLREYIRQQAMGLLNAVAEPMDISNMSLTDVVKLCGQKCGYQLWWQKEGANKLEVLKLDSPALDAARLQVFCQLFCHQSKSPDWQVEAAKQMLGELRQWQVKGLSDADCQYRPYLVFACYFHLLSSKHFKTDELNVDCYAARFVTRLPDKPLSHDGTFSSEQDLYDKLQKLLAHISQSEQSAKDKDVKTVLEQIRQALDYDSWHAQFSKLIVTVEEEKTPVDLRNFVARFSRVKH